MIGCKTRGTNGFASRDPPTTGDVARSYHPPVQSVLVGGTVRVGLAPLCLRDSRRRPARPEQPRAHDNMHDDKPPMARNVHPAQAADPLRRHRGPPQAGVPARLRHLLQPEPRQGTGVAGQADDV